MYSKVYVEISNVCNMRCSFCHGHSRAPRQMGMDEFTLILNKLSGYTQYLYYHLMGEPLTHPQLPDFIRLAGQWGYRSIITTNGTLLRQRQEALLTADVHKVNISLHSFENGTEEDHRRYIRELADFAKKASDTGTLVNFRLWNQGFDEGKNEFALKVLKETIPGDWVSNTRGIRIKDKVFIETAERFAWPDKAAPVQGNRFFCYGLKSHFGILADGTVVPCCLDSDGVIDLGNIFHQELTTILDSPKATALRRGFQCGKATEELCKRCGYAQRFVR